MTLLDLFKHLPGKHNQQRHAWRYGKGGARRSLRAVWEDKSEREEYKKRARDKGKKVEEGKGSEDRTKLVEMLSTNDMTLDTVKSDVKHSASEWSLGGITESYTVNVEGDGKAIVKPQVKHFASDVEKEVAAYELDAALGWDLVPPTVERKGGTYPHPSGTSPSAPASIQHWVSDAKVMSDMDKTEISSANVSSREISRIVLFDTIIGNGDRHSGNLLIKKDGKLVAIDHGLSDPYNSGKGLSKVPTQLPVTFENFKFFAAVRKFSTVEGAKIKYHPDDIKAVRNLLNSDTPLSAYKPADKGMRMRIKSMLELMNNSDKYAIEQ